MRTAVVCAVFVLHCEGGGEKGEEVWKEETHFERDVCWWCWEGLLERGVGRVGICELEVRWDLGFVRDGGLKGGSRR